MLRLLTYVIGIAFVFINTSDGQIDPNLCPQGPTSIPDPQWRPIPPRFEIITELVASDGVLELSQAFSLTRDAIATNGGTPLNLYWNFLTNEHFDIASITMGPLTVPKCFRTPIHPDSQTSVIAPNTLLLKPSALLGYNPRNQLEANWGNIYIGDGELRGIPTKQFKSCFYVNDIKATVAATYHVSDVEKFQAYLSRNQSIVLQIDVQVRNQTRTETYSYNVFRYIPNPSRREERQALETPRGVYCLNRTQTLHVPQNIPERASSSVETYVPFWNNSIISAHRLYDTEFQFTRFDAWYPDPSGGSAWLHMTELHDYGTGLSYHYDHSDRHCRVRDIDTGMGEAVPTDGDPSLLQMGNPQHLFAMDDIEYQYTGEKRCRDRVWCHVWIGEKPAPNGTVEHREWYWATNVNGEPLAQMIPMKFIIRRSLQDIPIYTFESSVFNFRRNPMTIFEIDYTLAECYRALGPDRNFNLAVLSFKIGNDKNYPVYQNLNYFRLHVWESLIFSMFVRPTRISHLIVDQEATDIIVTFTLLDAAPRTGPVENPLKEASLDKVVERLDSIINSEGLAFRARYENGKQVVLRARTGTLNIEHRSNSTVWKSSGPRITGLWLGLILVGALVGLVGGFVAFKKLAKN